MGIPFDEQEEEEEPELVYEREPDYCPICDGELQVLGALGRMIWKRCRNCGMEFSEKQE